MTTDYKSIRAARPHGKLEWIKCSKGAVPPNAVQGGIEATKERLFIGRALFKNSLIPGKVGPHITGIMVPYDCKEHRLDDYEVLTGDANLLRWVECRGRCIPNGWTPLECGYEPTGAELYIAKFPYKGGEVVGKVSPDMSSGMVFGYDCKEIIIKEGEPYYVLAHG